MTIQFRFNLQKAIEATSVILSCIEDKDIRAYKLLRYIYLFERCSLRDYDCPIVGGVNFLRGTPVSEDLYRILLWHNELPEDIAKNQEMWNQYFIVDRTNKGNPKISSRDNTIHVENLNDAEYCLIRDSCDYIRYLGLEDTNFGFPETFMMEINYQTLDTIDLLKTLGKTNEEIEEIRLVALRENYLYQLLGE